MISEKGRLCAETGEDGSAELMDSALYGPILPEDKLPGFPYRICRLGVIGQDMRREDVRLAFQRASQNGDKCVELRAFTLWWKESVMSPYPSAGREAVDLR